MLASFGRALRAIANGPDPARIPAPSEILATFDLGKPPADWWFINDVYLYTGIGSEAALAANVSIVALSNPLGSGIIATVESIRGRGTVASMTLRMAVADDIAAFDSDGDEYTRDVRTYRTVITPQPSRAPALKVLTDQVGAAPGQYATSVFPHHYDGATYHYFDYRAPIILLPGTAIVVVPNAVNNIMTAGFEWRERLYDPKEVMGTAFA